MILHHILLNARDELLKYVLETYGDSVCGNYGRHNFDEFVLDGNRALHLALALGGFSSSKV